MPDPVPRVDLRIRDQQLATEIAAGWRRVLEQGVFLEGDEVAGFEQAFAEFSGVEHCVGAGTGTDALELALRGVGVTTGDEVILPANAYVASALAVLRIGAVPVLVDPEPRSHLLDCDRVEDRVGPRTKAVMAVHLYGQLAPVEELQSRLDRRDVVLVEDAAQTHGATRHDRHAGCFGRVTATSFYPTKNLGAFGAGGAVLTPVAEVAAAVRRLRWDGFSSRLDAVQAVVLQARLKRLAQENERRSRAAARYDALLWDLHELERPLVLPGNEHVWHLYVVRVPERDRVQQQLLDAGIGTGVHYPVPLHLQPVLRPLGHDRGDFPVAEAAAASVLSLPMYPSITPDQQERVVDALRKALR